MKKILASTFVIAVALLSQGTLVSHAYADTAVLCPSGNDGDCPGDQECNTSQAPYSCVAPGGGTGAGIKHSGDSCKIDGECSGNLACIHSICQIDPSLEDAGAADANGQCGNVPNVGTNVECSGDQTCTLVPGQTMGSCTGGTGNLASGVGTNNSAAATGNCSSTDGFVSLSCIPGFADAESSSNLAKFFQLIYQMCIGIAAIIAVLQISRAGLMYITSGGNASKVGDARHLIEASLMGVVLVLSPILILNFINPSINNFSFLTTDISNLKIDTSNNGDINIGGSNALQVGSTTVTRVPTAVPFFGGQSLSQDVQVCNGNDCSKILNGSSCGVGFGSISGSAAVCQQTCVNSGTKLEDASKRTPLSQTLTCGAGQVKAVYIGTNSGTADGGGF